MDQYLTIHAEQYTPVGEGSIPLGENAAVEGTPMDFRKAHKIGDEIEADFEQLRITGGYDHNYVTDGYNKASIREIAEAWSEKTGIQMNVLTDCPCVQFYAANFVDQEHGKNGHVYNKREAFCLETQVEPNAVNVENFHSPILEAGERYYSENNLSFLCEEINNVVMNPDFFHIMQYEESRIFYFEEKNNDCRRQRMMKVLIVIMMAGMWCMQPEKASAADPVIRVLLTTTDFNSRYHQEITVSYDGKEITYTAEEVKKQGDKVRIPAQKDGIRILSIQRQSGTPVYDGSIEIIPKAEG